ncbi:MAG: UDP-N-acetylmuramate dehydrogenase [Parcubacteria group bacterium LiPW_39]|nr:MAG: UDP-N-acetylmuramate dehydrogenase [Parcubacteria group bacterium LiPW_39]
MLVNHTTFRIGGPAKYFFVAKTQKELIEVLRWAKENHLPYFILGGGSNLLVADEGFDGLVIKIQNSKFNPVFTTGQNDNVECKISAEAGVSFAQIILETTKNGYSGAEWGFGIPGTVGGAIVGNAGRLGRDIAPVVDSVKILDANFNEKIIPARECGFAYRESRFKKTGEIILSADLIFKKEQPEKIDKILSEAKAAVRKSPPFPSAGCIFKNYKLKENDSLLARHPELTGQVRGGKIGVGFLIDRCGLKGRQIGGAKIWEGHANYIINTGSAKAQDVLALIKQCKSIVKEKFGVELEEEIRYVGIESH